MFSYGKIYLFEKWSIFDLISALTLIVLDEKWTRYYLAKGLLEYSEWRNCAESLLRFLKGLLNEILIYKHNKRAPDSGSRP